MSDIVQLHRGTAAQVTAYKGPVGEVVVDTDNKRLVVQDGSTTGGFAAAKLSEVNAIGSGRVAVADTTHTVAATDRLIAYTSISASRAVTLIAAASYPVNSRLLVIDESGSCSGTNTIVISRASTDTIDGATSYTIASAYGFVALESDGVGKWTVVDASAMSGDGTITPFGVLTVTKTSGVPFGTGATINTGTSGAVIGLLNGGNTYSGNDVFSGTSLTLNASCTLGLNSNFTITGSSSGVVTFGVLATCGTGTLRPPLLSGSDTLVLAATAQSITNKGFDISCTNTAADTITAHSGGGQASATALTKVFNRVTVVAAPADSVKLPASAVGIQISVRNDSANALQLFGAGTDTINGAATGTGVSLAAGKQASLTCYTAGAWIGPLALA